MSCKEVIFVLHGGAGSKLLNFSCMDIEVLEWHLLFKM